MEEKMPSLKKNLSERVIYLLIIVITLNIAIYLAINNNVAKEDEVVKFLMQDKNNLTKVLDKIDRLEDSNYQKKIYKYYGEFITNDEFFIGNKDGEKIVIEFFDYNCGYCKRSFPELMELISENKDVKVILKELPVLGESSVLASKAAIASKKQNKYFLMHQELMNLSGKISINDIKDISGNIGINYEQLKTDMNKDETVLLIKESYRLADLIGVRGTPAFIINKKLIPGAIGKDEILKILKNDK